MEGERDETIDMKTGEVTEGELETTTMAPTQKGHVQVLRDMLEKDSMKEQITKALPKHMTAERMLRVALTAYQRNESLWECDARSICGCIVEASELGLEPNGIIAHAYMVPYNNKQTGIKQAQLQIGYRGLAELALRSASLLSIFPPEVVYEKDTYVVEKGMNPKLEHHPYVGDGNRGKIIAAYAIAKIAGQDEKPFVWLTLEDLEKLKARSPAKKNGPWVTDFPAMCKKSAIRQLCKHLPCRAEEQEAIAKDELRDLGIMQGNDFIGNPPAELPPSDRPQNLREVKADLQAKQEQPPALVAPEDQTADPVVPPVAESAPETPQPPIPAPESPVPPPQPPEPAETPPTPPEPVQPPLQAPPQPDTAVIDMPAEEVPPAPAQPPQGAPPGAPIPRPAGPAKR